MENEDNLALSNRMVIDEILSTLKLDFCPICGKFIPETEPSPSYQGQQYHKKCAKDTIIALEEAGKIIMEQFIVAFQPLVDLFHKLLNCGISDPGMKKLFKIVKDQEENNHG